MSWFSRLFNKNEPPKTIDTPLVSVDSSALTAEELATARRTNKHFKGLSDEAIRIATNQPLLWEYKLFFQTLLDEVEGYESLRQARISGIMPGMSELIPQAQTFSWLQLHSRKLTELGVRIDSLMNSDLQQAVGAPGQSGDAASIILVSRQVGLIYKQFLDISIQCIEVQHASVFDFTTRHFLCRRTFDYCSTGFILKLM